jgi:hypothetical protein
MTLEEIATSYPNVYKEFFAGAKSIEFLSVVNKPSVKLKYPDGSSRTFFEQALPLLEQSLIDRQNA